MDISAPLQTAIQAWQDFLKTNDLQELVDGVTPKQTGCGPVYELPNYLQRPNESFAIADMRNVKVAEPHYHPDEETEIYLVIQGTALVVVGRKEQKVGPGDAVVIQPNNAHFTIPSEDFVIAAINIPAFKPENYIAIPPDQDNPNVHYSARQFSQLAGQK